MSTLNQLLTEHRRSLLEQERHTASLEVRHNTGQSAETEIVNAQLEANEDAFTTDYVPAAESREPCPPGYGRWGNGPITKLRDTTFETDPIEVRHQDAREDDFVVERHPYSGWICYHKDHDWAPDAVNTFYRGHGATEAEAVQDYRELNDLCECGWEEGRSEADKRYHEENCSTRQFDSKEQWFADYQNPNSDPQDLQERAKDLGINGRDWQAYHERRAEAAKQF